MAEITQTGRQWEIIGDVFMDDANTLLSASQLLTIEEQTIVDFKKVGEVDTAAVSLMLEWKRRAIAEACTLNFSNMPNSLTSLLGLYGLSEMLN